MHITRTGIEIGPFDLLGLTINPSIHFYGVLIVLGVMVSAAVAAYLAKKDDKDPNLVWDGMLWAIVGGVIGARVWHVLFLPVDAIEAGHDTAWMLRNFFNLKEGPLIIWRGGLGFYGAILGGAVGAALFARRARLTDTWTWLDRVAVGVPLGHAIARWGNYINQELYGKPTHLPWGITIDYPPPQYFGETRFHPLFLYESLWNLLLFAALWWVWKNRRHALRPGSMVLLYAIGYNVARFLLEFLRVETARPPLLNINSSQMASALVIVIAGALLWRWHASTPQETPTSNHREKGENHHVE